MARSVIVTIPEPCHEKWSEMTPADRGRFCAACQKTVRDFTFATDSEIASAVNADAGLCGRFTSSQLHRTLYLKRPARKPYTIAAGIVALLGFGGYEAKAQEPVKTEQSERKNESVYFCGTKTVSGSVIDSLGLPLPGVKIYNLNSQHSVQTDVNGNYSIEGKLGDRFVAEFVGMKTQEFTFGDSVNTDIVMADEMIEVSTGIIITVQRTFLGRIFHRIGNWFR